MTTFAFSVELAGIDTDRDDYEAPFYGGACGDALLNVVDGKVFLDFDRDAPSYEEAVKSAIADVEKAGAKVVEITPLPD
ncbi:MAG TPA: hypothetical protein VNF04_18225 [Stellaceae bacterium]|nr:hypothetical protein [Stellaceae bacterium]